LTKDNFKSNVRNSKEMWLVAFVKYQWNSGIKSKWNQAAVELKAKLSKSLVKIRNHNMLMNDCNDTTRLFETPQSRPG
jgi:hypothetical protein